MNLPRLLPLLTLLALLCSGCISDIPAPPIVGPVYEISEVDRAPKHISDSPYAPVPLPRKEGQVVAAFVVDRNGFVRDVRVVRTTDPKLGELVVESLAKTLYEPGIKNGAPVNTKTQLTVTFGAQE
jgi:TonB family protein